MKIKKIEASGGAGSDHVPGQSYLDVHVDIVRQENGRWYVTALEVRGQCQGYDEELGRKTVTGRGMSIEEAVDDVRTRAGRVEINQRYLEEALSEAETTAYDEILKEETQA